MHSLRQQLVITVAAIGLIAGISGSAFAQDNPAQGANAPANERMEKGDKGAQQQQRRTHDTMGQQEDQRGAGAAGQPQRKAQSETGSRRRADRAARGREQDWAERRSRQARRRNPRRPKLDARRGPRPAAEDRTRRPHA